MAVVACARGSAWWNTAKGSARWKALYFSTLQYTQSCAVLVRCLRNADVLSPAGLGNLDRGAPCTLCPA